MTSFDWRDRLKATLDERHQTIDVTSPPAQEEAPKATAVKAVFPTVKEAAQEQARAEPAKQGHESGAHKTGADAPSRQAEGSELPWNWISADAVSKDTFPAPGAQPHLASGVLDPARSAPAGAESTRRVPAYGMPTSDASGVLLWTDAPVDRVLPFPGLEFVRDAYAVYVPAETMAPRYRTGDLVYVNPVRPAGRGDSVVAHIKSDGKTIAIIAEFVGQDVAMIHLRKLNPMADLRIPAEHVRAMHKIVGTRYA